jgi:hypothetical protein
MGLAATNGFWESLMKPKGVKAKRGIKAESQRVVQYVFPESDRKPNWSGYEFFVDLAAF